MHEAVISRASTTDAEEILLLQRLAYQAEARVYQDWSIPPLTQSLSALIDEFPANIFLKATTEGRLTGSIRAVQENGVCRIGRLIVHPEFQRHGIGTRLLLAMEAEFPQAARFELFTGAKNAGNLRLYLRHGYVVQREQAISAAVTLVFLAKERTAARR